MKKRKETKIKTKTDTNQSGICHYCGAIVDRTYSCKFGFRHLNTCFKCHSEKLKEHGDIEI